MTTSGKHCHILCELEELKTQMSVIVGLHKCMWLLAASGPHYVYVKQLTPKCVASDLCLDEMSDNTTGVLECHWILQDVLIMHQPLANLVFATKV